MEKRFSKATFVLLFLSILTLAAIITPVAKAGNLSVTLNPSEGPAGTMVVVTISGFQPSDSVSITFDTTNVGTITTYYSYNVASMEFTVPQVSLGTYTVTATDSLDGGVATTTFTVTQASSPTPTETPTGASTGIPTWVNPTNSPVIVSTGFWSPLMIAIILAVIAFVSFMTVVYVKRGKQKTSQVQETSLYKPRPSVPSMKPTAASKINQPATNSLQPPFTKACRHCKRTVKDDLNVCPYCLKRLK